MYWTEDGQRFRELIERLAQRPVDPETEAEMGGPLRPRWDFALECVKAGEELVGLDALCHNVSDYRVPLTAEDRSVITHLADRWGQQGFDLSSLDELVTTEFDRSA
jgi:hypothetical protein